MATLTVKRSSRTPGINYSTDPVAASSGGDKWVNTGQELFWIVNSGNAPITLTQVFGPMATIDGIAPASRQVTVPNGVAMAFGPFSPQQYNDANGMMSVQYSGVSNVFVLVQALGS
jgi:hypothetical protein